MNVEKLRRKVGRINDVATALDDAISHLLESGDDATAGLLRLSSSSLYDIERDVEDIIRENNKEEK